MIHPRETGFTTEPGGEIAGMAALAFGMQGRTAARDGIAVPDAHLRSMKVVAGARNHREPNSLVVAV